MKMQFNPTPQAHWQALIEEAKRAGGVALDDNVQCYLLLTLDGYMKQAEPLGNDALGQNFLQGLQSMGKQRIEQLRDVGDQCLILSGLFPERAIGKNVTVDYFINLGQQAYHFVSEQSQSIVSDPKLFFKLGNQFISLMELLQMMRSLSPSLH